MPDDTPGSETGDRQFLTPEDAAPALEAFLFPAEADRNESQEQTSDADATADADDDTQTEAHADDDAAQDEAAETDDEAQSDETTDTDDETSQPPKRRIVLEDGTEEEVQEDELVETYRRKKAQFADYTRKTMALSDERKAFEAEKADVTARAERYAEALKQLEDALKVEEPDWDAIQRENPAEFPTLFANWQRQERQREVVKREREATEAKVAEERQKKYAQMLADERAKLLEAVPEWNPESDEGKKRFQADQTQMIAYARERGFSDADIAGIVDHRVIQLWRDATLWRQAVKQKPTVEKRAAPKVKTATPGGGSSAGRKQPTEAERAANRLKRTGRVEDAAKVFEQFV